MTNHYLYVDDSQEWISNRLFCSPDIFVKLPTGCLQLDILQGLQIPHLHSLLEVTALPDFLFHRHDSWALIYTDHICMILYSFLYLHCLPFAQIPSCGKRLANTYSFLRPNSGSINILDYNFLSFLGLQRWVIALCLDRCFLSCL